MPKKEYRIIKYADNDFAIRLLRYHDKYISYSNDILWSETFEGLRSEVNKVIEAFGKEVIRREDE